METTDPKAGYAISFGPFRLLPAQRLLLAGDAAVRLGSRAFDILAALVERAGEVVGKEALMARAWPETVVEEANIKIQVSALRRALGDGQGGGRYVITVPGRGYNFVAPVHREEAARDAVPPAVASASVHNLPLAMTRMIGREEAVAALVSRLSRERLVTVVGPGGIGKTTVALAVAERMIDDYAHGVWLVDLAPLNDPRLVPSAVATTLGLETRNENPLPGLVAGLRDRRMLLLLDNCEHVIDAVASLAMAILGGARDVSILLTTREPLGIPSEHVYRVGPLSTPRRSASPTAAEAAAFTAIQLFIERVTAIVEHFVLTDENASTVAEICRRLDGLPLAIEFAAPRVEVLGVEGLATHLGVELPRLRARVRASPPRHRTMRAVVDWSYGLLSKDEQRFLRALGIFAGGFTVEAAASVAIDAVNKPSEAIDRLADLVAKSLIVADVSGTTPRFRLLDTIRDYTLEQLGESGDGQQVARRHAAYYRGLFEHAEGEAPALPADEWLAYYAPEIDNLRLALDWAFSSSGDGSIGVALTTAGVPLWMRLSLLEECRVRAKHALGAVRTDGAQDPRQAMRLHAALGVSTPDVSEMGAAFTKVLDVAESLGDSEYQLRALRGLYFYHTGSSRYRAALPFAQKFHDLTMNGSDLNDRLFGERSMGAAKHFLGDQIGARAHLEHVLAHYAAADHGRDVIRFQDVVRFGTDLRVSARVFLARVLWLQGFSDQAVRAAETSVAEAQATGHTVSLCYALALAACPIALWVGNLATAAHYTRRLVDLSRESSLPQWAAFGSRFQRTVVLIGREVDAGSRQPRAGSNETAEPNVDFRFMSGLSELAEALAHAGRIAEALAVIEGALEQSELGWLTPELLRLKGEIILLQSAPELAGAAEHLLRQALDGAKGTLAWELRAAMSLARLLRNQGRPADAIACLQPVYDRFTEGFGTGDLIAARQLLDEFGDAHHD